LPTHVPPSTWHYGLVARWWAEFNQAEPHEVDWLAALIHRHGEPALDLGCGTGRLLIPLRARGLDIDGADISADMIATCRAGLDQAGLSAGGLTVGPMSAVDPGRRYRVIFMAGALGLASTRSDDRRALELALVHLEPGGVFTTDWYAPYSNPRGWAAWPPSSGRELPTPWPEWSDEHRKTTNDGDQMDLISRVLAFDPLEQRAALELWTRRWHAGELAGFEDITVTKAYRDDPPEPSDLVLSIVARRGA
jgi:SAM-dependent methyltransferase